MDERERKIEELEREISHTIEIQMKENQELRVRQEKQEADVKRFKEFE